MSADLRLKLLFAVTLLMAAALATGVVPVAAQAPDASTTSATSPTTPTTPSTTTTAPETPTTPTTPTIPTTPATPTTPIAPTTPRQAPPTRTTEQSPRRKATGRPRARKAPKAKVKREGRGRAKRRRAREKPPERCLRLGEWKRWRHELLAEGRRREAEKLELCKRDRRKRDHGKARKEDRLAPFAPSRNTDGSPTPANPGFMDALPGPSSADGVPNFVIRKFRVPIFLLPIYQAAGIEYGIRWELLAAINEIETDYGRNLGVSSAGAVGWMQFLPSSWALYGVDGNEDGRRDPYNPVDAIFSAARYLKAAGYEDDVRGAIFAYNHADWYVDSVLLRARLIAGMPSELVGSLTGLTEGRFPVTEHATYADDIEERDVVKRVGPGENAANVIESSPNRRSIRIFSRPGAPVVAVNDGVIKRVDETPELGRFIVLEDVYGNRYTYAHLGEVASLYPVPSEETGHTARTARAIAANPPADPRPAGAASAGRQPEPAARRRPARRPSARGAHASAPVKQRLFAHPDHPLARASGGAEQLLEQSRRRGPGVEVYGAHFARPFGVDAGQVRLRPLRKGARVIGGTVLGRVGATVPGAASHVEFSIRPEGRGAPAIDPKPILDGWKLLEDTAIYRSSGRNVLHGDDGDGMSIGQVLLLPKPLLERRVLADERIEIYACGRRDIRSGQIDRRVLATLAFLAESGLRPRVTSLRCGHSYLTKSGNVSHHSSGNAADIAAVNGVPIVGHQDPGGIAEETVRQLLRLQGTLEPAQVISLLELGGPTLAMSDHADHIHVGFRPTGPARSFGVLRPRQWSDLVGRLREIENPTVPTKASRWSLPARPGAARNGGD